MRVRERQPLAQPLCTLAPRPRPHPHAGELLQQRAAHRISVRIALRLLLEDDGAQHAALHRLHTARSLVPHHRGFPRDLLAEVAADLVERERCGARNPILRRLSLQLGHRKVRRIVQAVALGKHRPTAVAQQIARFCPRTSLRHAIGKRQGEQRPRFGIVPWLQPHAAIDAPHQVVGALLHAPYRVAIGTRAVHGERASVTTALQQLGAEPQVGRCAAEPLGAHHIALLQQRGNRCAQWQLSARLRGEHQMRESRLERQRRHALAVGGDASLGIECTQLGQQLPRLQEGAGTGRVEPAQLRRIGNAGIGELQGQARQIGIDDLRARCGEKAVLLVHIPQPVAHARCGTPGAPAPLVGRGAAHAHGVQPRQPGHCIVARNARPAGIDHHAHAFHGEARFGHAGAEHHLASSGRRRCERRLLLIQRHAAVQHEDIHRGRHAPHQPLRRAALFTHAGQKHQHVALARGECIPHDATRCSVHALVAAWGAMMGGDGKHATAAAYDRCRPPCVGQKPRHGLAVEGGRHHQHPQIVAHLLRLQHQREAKVGVQRALVELVEEHGRIAVERGVGRQHPRQHPFGDHLDARVLRHPRVAAHAVPHGPPNGLAKLPRHEVRGGACGEATGFEHDQALSGHPWLGQQRQRHARGLAGSRRGFEHGHAAHLQRGGECVEHLLDGQRRGQRRRQADGPQVEGRQDTISGVAPHGHRAAVPTTPARAAAPRRSRCGSCAV